MAKAVERRKFLYSILALPLLATAGINLPGRLPKTGPFATPSGSRLKISLNAYSFNDQLRNNTLNLEGLLDFCAATGFDAADLTGYYFPGYPVVPPDDYLFRLKRKALKLGVEISGTGVRNDFTQPDRNKRNEDIRMVKNWITCAAKIGAPVIRIFSGTQNPPGFTWDQVAAWMVTDIRECVEFGKKNGVVVAIQNHNDFIQTAEQTKKIIEMVDSEWFGLILDTGSFRQNDPYAQIAQCTPYAVSWQIKEKMVVNGKEQDMDLDKLSVIIKSSGYNGYLPIETLGAGDPRTKVPVFLEKVRKSLGLPA